MIYMQFVGQQQTTVARENSNTFVWRLEEIKF